MIRNTLNLPETAEALLSETRRETLLDARVADVAVLLAPEVARPREEGEPDVEFATRAWRFLLPDHTTSEDALRFRTEHGWSAKEVAQITRLLHRSADACRNLVFTAVLEGTRSTLLQQAERLDRLAKQWVV